MFLVKLSAGVVHLAIEDCSEELLSQHSYAIKNQLVASKAPCMEAHYPFAIKSQRGASKKTHRGL